MIFYDKLNLSGWAGDRLQNYVLIGTGGHATSILDLITSNGNKVQYFVGFNSDVKNFKGIPIVDISEIGNLPVDLNFVFGIGDFEIRNKVLEEIKLSNQVLKFPPLIHSTAFVSSSADIGLGTVVFANAYVGPNAKIGNFCVLNTATSIDHDCLIGDQNFLAPGTILAGGVTTGEKCFFGMGSLVSNNISVGRSSVVAANSFVNENIPSNSFAAGTPAKLK